MTQAREARLQALRLRYNAALAAQQGCARALSEATIGGTPASSALVEMDAKARAELERARAALLAAMTESITGQPAPPGRDEPPLSSPPGKPPPDAA